MGREGRGAKLVGHLGLSIGQCVGLVEDHRTAGIDLFQDHRITIARLAAKEIEPMMTKGIAISSGHGVATTPSATATEV